MLRAVVLIGSLLLSAQALACSCPNQPEDINEAVGSDFRDASAVVLAEATIVVESKEGGTEEQPFVSTHETTQFSLIHGWKGNLGDRFVTKVNTTCCMCGFPFQQGEIYLLYLDGPYEGGTYSTGICSRTRPVSAAVDDLGVLNRLAPARVFATEVETPAEPATAVADQ